MKERIYRQGERIGEWEVQELIAMGTFSAVYKVKPIPPADDEEGGSFDDVLDEPPPSEVALKICRFDMAELPDDKRKELSTRLHREHVQVGVADHPGIVRSEGGGWHEGKPYFAMELLAGPTLGEYLAEPKRRRYRELLALFLKVTEAVAYCHHRGIVHRDIKPSNIIVEPERGPVLIDFSISLPCDRDLFHQQLTAPGALLGALEFRAPEYAAYLLSPERELKPFFSEPRQDVYSLGVLLYSLLTGRYPTNTPGEQLIAFLTELRDAVPAHPRAVNPEAPKAASELAMLLLSKDVHQRPADAQKLPELVRAALEADGPGLFGLAPEHGAMAAAVLSTVPALPSPSSTQAAPVTAAVAPLSPPGSSPVAPAVAPPSPPGSSFARRAWNWTRSRALRAHGGRVGSVVLLMVATGALAYGLAQATGRSEMAELNRASTKTIAVLAENGRAITEANSHLTRVLERLVVQSPSGRASTASDASAPAGVLPTERDHPLGSLASGTSQMGEKAPPEKWVPKRPFPWQLRAPDCNPATGEEAINGGCWVYIAKVTPPCGELFRHGEGCYRPVAADSQRPMSEKP